MLNKKNILIVIASIIIIILVIFLFKKQDPEVIKVPVKITIPIPVKIGYSDTIFKPSPIKENPINKDLVKKFKEAEDKLSLYEEAIKEREYNLSFDDSVQTINVYTKVQGKLLSQASNYITKPYTVDIDTVLNVPVKNKIKVFAGVSVSVPFLEDSYNKPTFQANLLIKNKKDNIILIGFDSKKYIHAGYNIKL